MALAPLVSIACGVANAALFAKPVAAEAPAIVLEAPTIISAIANPFVTAKIPNAIALFLPANCCNISNPTFKAFLLASFIDKSKAISLSACSFASASILSFSVLVIEFK